MVIKEWWASLPLQIHSSPLSPVLGSCWPVWMVWTASLDLWLLGRFQEQERHQQIKRAVGTGGWGNDSFGSVSTGLLQTCSIPLVKATAAAIQYSKLLCPCNTLSLCSSRPRDEATLLLLSRAVHCALPVSFLPADAFVGSPSVKPSQLHSLSSTSVSRQDHNWQRVNRTLNNLTN